MPILQNISLFFVILLIFLLSGCSSVKIQDPVYSAGAVSRADLLSGQAIFGTRAKNITLPEDHVIALNDQMRAYLDRYVPRNYAEQTQIRILMTMMLGSGTLNMKYDVSKTHNAQEAFRKSEGNCLAFSYLFTAFARERGLNVSFQEVQIPPVWRSAGGDLYYFSRHVNIRAQMKGRQDVIIDINTVNYKSHYKAWIISDKSAIALYYSNKGTDYLLESDFENAFRYLAKALALSPRDGAIWSNLGVMYRMQGLYEYAEKAYFVALKYDNAQRSVLNNLIVLYDEIGETEKSEYYLHLVKEHQMRNPYFRYYQAIEAYQAGDYRGTLSHLKAALKNEKKEQKFHYLLGETYAKLGDDTRAGQAWDKAKALRP